MPNFLMNAAYGVAAVGLAGSWYYLLAAPEDNSKILTSLAISLVGILTLLIGGWRRNT